MNLSTSDVFDDDSFFSESILLSTQALEEEAIGCKPTPPKKCKNELLITPSSPTSNSSHIFSFAQPSPEQSVFRKSFDLESEEPSEKISNENVTKLGKHCMILLFLLYLTSQLFNMCITYSATSCS